MCKRELILGGLVGPRPPEGWKCNGCGGRYTGWLVPDWWFRDACVWHDWAYARIAARLHSRVRPISRVRAFRWRRLADYQLWRNIVYLSGVQVCMGPRGYYLRLNYLRPRAWAGLVIGGIYCVAVRLFGVRAAR